MGICQNYRCIWHCWLELYKTSGSLWLFCNWKRARTEHVGWRFSVVYLDVRDGHHRSWIDWITVLQSITVHSNSTAKTLIAKRPKSKWGLLWQSNRVRFLHVFTWYTIVGHSGHFLAWCNAHLKPPPSRCVIVMQTKIFCSTFLPTLASHAGSTVVHNCRTSGAFVCW